jgi:Flp pilus assembly pilin Flp
MNNLLIMFLMTATLSIANPWVTAEPIGAQGETLFTFTDLARQAAAQAQFTWYLTDNDRELCYQEISDLTIPFDVCSTKPAPWNPPAWQGVPLLPPTWPITESIPCPSSEVPEPQLAYLIALPIVLARPKAKEALRQALLRAALLRMRQGYLQIQRLPKATAGQDLLEMALIVGLVAIACAACLPPVAAAVSTVFQQISSTMSSAAQGGGQ